MVRPRSCSGLGWRGVTLLRIGVLGAAGAAGGGVGFGFGVGMTDGLNVGNCSRCGVGGYNDDDDDDDS